MGEHRRAFSHRARGFTLLEVLTVVVVLVCVGAVALPRYANSVARARLNATLNRLLADFALARSTAMATGSPVTITFSGSSYSIIGLKPLNTATATYAVNLNANPYYSTLPLAVFGINLKTITFDVYGTPDNSGSLWVSNGGIIRTITVEGTMGKLSW